MSERTKMYVPVSVDFRDDGTMLPRSIQWEDGRTYTIDRVVHICQAAASVGGNGDRYTIEVNGNQCYGEVMGTVSKEVIEKMRKSN